MSVSPVMLHMHATAVVTRQLVYLLPLTAKHKAAMTPMKEVYPMDKAAMTPMKEVYPMDKAALTPMKELYTVGHTEHSP